MHFKIKTQKFTAAFIIFLRILRNIINISIYSRGIAEKRSSLYILECHWLSHFCQLAITQKEYEEIVYSIRVLYEDVVYDLFQYFEGTYIGRYRGNVPRRPLLFAINLWNMSNITDVKLPRTNNSVEGWRQSFQSHVSACHPAFWKFLSVLQKEENVIRISIIPHLAGHPAPPPRQRYSDSS